MIYVHWEMSKDFKVPMDESVAVIKYFPHVIWRCVMTGPLL